MAWSWSHTAEAYENARQNLEEKDREWLEECYAEWYAVDDPTEYAGGFNEEKYNSAMESARGLPSDVLSGTIWDRAEEKATCDNGGFNAWCCPDGCHSVSFDR